MKKIYSLVLLVAGVFSWGSCSLDEVNPKQLGSVLRWFLYIGNL